jgi:hypothetical protein
VTSMCPATLRRQTSVLNLPSTYECRNIPTSRSILKGLLRIGRPHSRRRWVTYTAIWSVCPWLALNHTWSLPHPFTDLVYCLRESAGATLNCLAIICHLMTSRIAAYCWLSHIVYPFL